MEAARPARCQRSQGVPGRDDSRLRLGGKHPLHSEAGRPRKGVGQLFCFPDGQGQVPPSIRLPQLAQPARSRRSQGRLFLARLNERRIRLDTVFPDIQTAEFFLGTHSDTDGHLDDEEDQQG